MTNKVHAFTNDALGNDDATAIAERIRSGDISAREALDAAIARVESVESKLSAVQCADFERARNNASRKQYGHGFFAGVPFIIKDNTDVEGLQTKHGSAGLNPKPAQKNGVLAEQLLAQGFVNIGKSKMPEFGFNASTEYRFDEPTRNPWNTDFSCGASSGGSAALVAAGALPMAHANDGGGSIRIPAACCGLVGLKPSINRLVVSEQAKSLPVNIIGDGVVTRSVRDTANFYSEAEKYHMGKNLKPVGLVTGPNSRRLRIGYLIDSIESITDLETRAAVENTVQVLRNMGHDVQEIDVPVTEQFADDFKLYWAMLAFFANRMGKIAVDKSMQNSKVDGLTQGLTKHFQSNVWRIPGAIRRLKRNPREYSNTFADYDVMLSPVLAHTTPEIGYLSPNQPFEQLMQRLSDYVSFTPVNNTSGGPAVSLPLAQSEKGLPIGLHFSANIGDERTLLELAFELEEAQAFQIITA